MINKIKLIETNTTNIPIAEQILNEKLEFLDHKDNVIKNITMNIIDNQIVFFIQYEHDCNSKEMLPQRLANSF